MGSSNEQHSVIYTGIPDKITAAFKYERLTRPLQPPSDLLYSILGIIKSLLVTCLSWAPSVTKGSRLLDQCLSAIWFDCFCLHGLIRKSLEKSLLQRGCLIPILLLLFSLAHSLFILFSYFLALNGWMDKAGMPEACEPLASHEQITEATALSSKLFRCSCVRRWVPLAYREELYHVLRLSGPLVSPLFVPCLSHVLQVLQLTLNFKYKSFASWDWFWVACLVLTNACNLS